MNKGHVVYVALGPLATDRKSLAPATGEQERVPMPEELKGVPLDDPNVRKAYLHYARRAVKQFHPRYLNLGIEAGEWLIKQNPMLVGTDTCCVEVRPYPEQKMNLPIHAMFLIANGVYLVENLRLEPLAAARAYETAYIMTPLKIEGGTGSTIDPIAVR
jgi:kynurenine formamidase